MSLFKSILIAILATLSITYFLGTSLLDFLHISIDTSDSWRRSVEAINMSALGVIALTLIVFLALFTLCGVFILVLALIVSCIVFAVIGAFWPMMLAAILIYFLCRNKPEENRQCY